MAVFMSFAINAPNYSRSRQNHGYMSEFITLKDTVFITRGISRYLFHGLVFSSCIQALLLSCNVITGVMNISIIMFLIT